MTILRAALLLLVLGNLLLLAAVGGYLGGGSGGEPERLADQLDAQKIVVLRVGPEAAGAREGTDGAAAAGSQSAAANGVKSEHAAAAPGGAGESCQRFASVTRDKATRIAALAREAKLKVVQKSLEEPSAWWVHIPSQPSREEVDQRVAELRAAGHTDFFVIQDAGANRFALSLGLFKLERMAQDLRDRLRAKGVSQARVTPRENAAGKVAVELRGAAEPMEGVLARVAASVPEVAPQACGGGQ